MLALLLTIGSLAACGKGNETPSTTSSAATTPTTTTTTTTTPPASHAGLNLVSFSTASFAGSANCAICHTNLTDAGGANVSIDTHWRSTMMSNAARDPYFRAKVSAEIANASHLQGVIEDVCGTCHTPMARTQSVDDGTESLLFGPGFFNTSNALHKAGIDGVSCTLCHQIQPTGLGQEETFAGGYVIDTSSVAPDRVIFSQFANPQTQMMMSASGFTPVQGEHLGEAALCAVCHTVITPFIDASGNVQGTFPEQVPFLEWSHSSFAGDTPCQGCHMPSANGSAKTASMPPNLAAKSPFSQHFFVGGNSHVLEMLRDNAEALAVTASSANFNSTVARALDQLQNRTADISIVESALQGQTLSVTVNVANETGHKLPTGFPSRRVWVNFQVTDAGGRLVFESGKPNADGSIAGNQGDASLSAYEPHYDVITSADQVQIYEAILGNMTGGVTHKLLEASGYIKDNRLLPAGFDKTSAGELIAVWGTAVDDADFTGGSDNVTYQVNTAGFNGPFTVTVNLYYQSLAYSTIEALFEFDTPEVRAFEAIYEASNKAPTLIYSISRTIS
jgi:hypothetical protein